MALRLRRGLDVERSSIIFAEGEPVFATDTKRIWIGDGVTPGGAPVSGLPALVDDSSPMLGANLDLNSNQIVGYGSFDIVGNIKVQGFIDADYHGSLYAQDSTIIVDGTNRKVHASIMSDDGILAYDSESNAFNLSGSKLQSFSDVMDPTAPGDILQWDGVNWVSQPFGADSLGQNPAHMSVMQYVAGTGWISSTEPHTVSSTVLFDTVTGIINLNETSIDSLKDVFIDPADINVEDVLTWDGAQWTHKPVAAVVEGPSNIVDLLDVNENMTPNVYDVLMWDGAQWTSTAQTGESALDILTPNPGDVLTWDGSIWVNQQPSASGTNPLAGLNPAIGDMILYNGTTWMNSAASINTIEGITPNIGQYLVWQGANWAPADLLITDMADVHTPNQQIGDAMIYDGVNWVTEQLELETHLSDVEVFTPQVNDVLSWNGVAWVNMPMQGGTVSTSTPQDYIGTFKGSVLGSDSSIIINSDTSAITADNITASAITADNITVEGILANSFESDSIDIRAIIDSRASLRMEKVDDTISFTSNFDSVKSDLSQLGDRVGMIRFTSRSILDTPNESRWAYVSAWAGALAFCHSLQNGDVNEEYVTLSEGNLNIGALSRASEKLEVQGNTVVNGFVQFGSLTAVERDALTAANGMVIYNTDVNKFQGYANGAWVDLH